MGFYIEGEKKMGMDAYWEDYTSSEKSMFTKACRRLLKGTFVVRDRDEDSKKLYYFITKRPDPISLYFSYIGFEIVIDRENGVVMLKNCAQSGEDGKIQANRYALRKVDSMVLCCLWTLYIDRIRSGRLSRAVQISMTDLRLELDKYGLKDLVDKSTMSAILTIFSSYNLLDLEGKVGDPDCQIWLYPSLQFALNTDEIRRFVENADRRMRDLEDEDENEDRLTMDRMTDGAENDDSEDAGSDRDAVEGDADEDGDE